MSAQLPAAARIVSHSLAIVAHSVGAEADGGRAAFERGPGARLAGQVDIAAMCQAGAVETRAALHALRGRHGVLLLRIPVTREPEAWGCAGATTGVLFSDCMSFTDDTSFTDAFQPGAGSSEYVGTATIAAGSDQMTLSAALVAAPGMGPGMLLYVGAPEFGGQAFRVVSLSGSVATVRPIARASHTNNPAVAGAIRVPFKIVGDTPVIPMLGRRSLPFSFHVQEVI